MKIKRLEILMMTIMNVVPPLEKVQHLRFPVMIEEKKKKKEEENLPAKTMTTTTIIF
jgi:hypothetical protein